MYLSMLSEQHGLANAKKSSTCASAFPIPLPAELQLRQPFTVPAPSHARRPQTATNLPKRGRWEYLMEGGVQRSECDESV